MIGPFALAPPDRPEFRVQSPDGLWHLVRQHGFMYSEGRNENWTHCGLQLSNPPFVVWSNHDFLHPVWVGPKRKDSPSDPEPRCGACPEARRKVLHGHFSRIAESYS